MKKIILKENLGVSTKSVSASDKDAQLAESYHNTYNTLRRMEPDDKKCPMTCPYAAWVKEKKREKDTNLNILTSYHNTSNQGKISAR